MIAIILFVGGHASYLDSALHYLSMLSGPMLACVCGGFLTLIPIHNVLENPEYWYEDIACRILSSAVILTCQSLLRAEYWCNFSFENKTIAYVGLITVVHGIVISSVLAHYYVWTVYFGLYQPMALGHFVLGSILVVVINTTIWFW